MASGTHDMASGGLTSGSMSGIWGIPGWGAWSGGCNVGYSATEGLSVWTRFHTFAYGITVAIVRLITMVAITGTPIARTT